MSQTFLTKSNSKSVNLEPIALVGHDAVLTRGRRSTKEGGALLTVRHESAILLAAVSAAGKMLTQHISYPVLGMLQ